MFKFLFAVEDVLTEHLIEYKTIYASSETEAFDKVMLEYSSDKLKALNIKLI